MCAHCENPWKLMWSSEPLARNMRRHSLLYQCQECGCYYEIIPEERRTPERLSEEQVANRFPQYRASQDG